VPCVSRFFGIKIYMYWEDHAPPHFHAFHAGEELVVIIETLQVLAGSLSGRSKARVLAWAAVRKDELTQNWLAGQSGKPMVQIDGFSK
jgi:hypothetical protein